MQSRQPRHQSLMKSINAIAAQQPEGGGGGRRRSQRDHPHYRFLRSNRRPGGFLQLVVVIIVSGLVLVVVVILSFWSRFSLQTAMLGTIDWEYASSSSSSLSSSSLTDAPLLVSQNDHIIDSTIKSTFISNATKSTTIHEKIHFQLLDDRPQREPSDVEHPDDIKHHGDEKPHTFLNDLHYRRICTRVYHSVFCMIVRFPFVVPLQDPTVSYPKPVPPRMYKLVSNHLFLDGNDLNECRQQQQNNNNNHTMMMSIHDSDNNDSHTLQQQLKLCMENLAKQHSNRVIAAFTRRRVRLRPKRQQPTPALQSRYGEEVEDEGETWYGVKSPEQQLRTHQFFHNHVVVFVGASPTASVVRCMNDIFGLCQFRYRLGYWVCRRHHHIINSTTTTTTTMTTNLDDHPTNSKKRPKSTAKHFLHDNEIVLFTVRYEPPVELFMRGNQTVEHRPRHIVNHTMPLLEFLKLQNLARFGAPLHHKHNTTADTTTTSMAPPLALRPLSIIVEYPFAHMQTQDMIMELYDQVRYNQKRYPQLIMNITTRAAREELANHMGLQLRHVIVFDGLPQHFPTATGGYTEKIHEHASQRDFEQHHGYPEWRSDYGSSCRGPLPPNSPLAAINDMSRRAFYELGLDMTRWYGRTWEFANQFWWQEIMWMHARQTKMLDCVHPMQPKTGFTCIHKYFVQAMIDDYYDEHRDEKGGVPHDETIYE